MSCEAKRSSAAVVTLSSSDEAQSVVVGFAPVSTHNGLQSFVDSIHVSNVWSIEEGELGEQFVLAEPQGDFACGLQDGGCVSGLNLHGGGVLDWFCGCDGGGEDGANEGVVHSFEKGRINYKLICPDAFRSQSRI